MMGMQIIAPAPDIEIPTSSLDLWNSLQALIMTPNYILLQFKNFVRDLKAKNAKGENITDEDVNKLKLFWIKFKSAHNYTEFDRRIRPFHANVDYENLKRMRKNNFFLFLHPDKCSEYSQENKEQVQIAFKYIREDNTSRPMTAFDNPPNDATSIILIKTVPNIIVHQLLTGGMILIKKIFPGFLRDMHLEKHLSLLDERINENEKDAKLRTTMINEKKQTIQCKKEILQTKISFMKMKQSS